jgi:hypothetical protein
VGIGVWGALLACGRREYAAALVGYLDHHVLDALREYEPNLNATAGRSVYGKRDDVLRPTV